MKFQANTKTLKTLTELHKKVATSKSLISAISGVMFDTTDNNIKIYSTNLESSIISEIKGNIINPGKCVIPEKIVENVINCNESDKTEFELMNDKCKVDKMKINTFATDEFPEFPKIDYNKASILKKLDAGSFITSLDKVIRFASHEESRVILTGILFDTVNNTMVGTDSYRLGTSFYCFGRDIGKLVISSKILEILKAIQKKLKADKFDIIAEENQIAFIVKSDDITITLISRLLSGKFPEYENLIPGDFKYQYKINSEAVIKVLDKALKLIPKDIPIKFNFNTVKADIFANVKEVGDYEDEIKVKSIKKDEEELFIAFNPDFLKDGIKEFDTEFDFYANGTLDPVLLQNTDDFKYLIMPVRINKNE